MAQTGGAPIAYTLYDRYNSTVRAAHPVLLPFPSLTPAQLEAQNISLDALESFEEARFMEWNTKGQGYFLMQSTRVGIAHLLFRGLKRTILMLLVAAQHHRSSIARQSSRSARLDCRPVHPL